MATVPSDNEQFAGMVPNGGGAPGSGLGTIDPPTTKDCPPVCSVYCPQWCYYGFTPPPPFDFTEDGGGDSSGPTFSPLVIAIIGILGSAFLLIAYYTIISKYCARFDSLGSGRRRRRRDHATTPLTDADDGGTAAHHLRHLPGPDGWQNAALVSEGLDEAVIRSIGVCRYKRGDGFVEGTDCPVCLTEFRDGEDLRLLPKCGHAFHVSCIDTWFKSHSNCPLCRANIAPIPLPMPPAPARPPPPPMYQQQRRSGTRDPPARVPSNGSGFTAVAMEDLLLDRGGSGRRDGVVVPGTAAAAASIKDHSGNAATTMHGIPSGSGPDFRREAVMFEIREDVGGHVHSSRRRDHRVVSMGEVLDTEDDGRPSETAAGSTSSGRRVMVQHSRHYGTSNSLLHYVMNGPVGRLYFGDGNNNSRHNGNDNNSASSTHPQ